MPIISCPRCVGTRGEVVNGDLRFKTPNKSCKLCGGKGFVNSANVSPIAYNTSTGWQPFEKYPILGWIINGILFFVTIGTFFAVASFTPALTRIEITDSWRTIKTILAIYVVFGGLVGLLGYIHYLGQFQVADCIATKMFLCFWGLVINLVISYFFNHLPEVRGAELNPVLIRCSMGALAGFLAGALMGWRLMGTEAL